MNRDKKIDEGVVYSTELGRMCSKCQKAKSDCVCKKERKVSQAKADGFVRIRRETKGRKGKGVVVIGGLALSDLELVGLAKELKKKCGAGGAVKDGEIEIQGDHSTLIREELIRLGLKVK